MGKSVTMIDCEAALCIWENMIETRDVNGPMDSTWHTMGSVAMRHAAIALAPVACAIWDTMSDDEQQVCIPYDWGFIPAFVGLVDWAHGIDWVNNTAAIDNIDEMRAAVLATFAECAPTPSL
ncbi:hypothetical protein G3A39_42335 [Paraburkholderia aspalathi]|nr:hypothetical protein [Paraburkholderia aspalathi]